MRTRTWLTFGGLVAVIWTSFLLAGCRQAPPTATAVPTHTLPAAGEEAVAPTALPVVSPTTASLLYTVQPGDTLLGIAQTYGVSVEALVAANDLANPDVIAVGQTLVIPANGSQVLPATLVATEPSPISAPSPTLLPTLTPSGPPLIEIGQALGCGDLGAEVVVVRNRGGAVGLEGWTLADAEGNVFTFPPFILFDGAQVRIHSAGGDSTPWDLYWGRANPAWSSGELLTLRDAAGEVVDTCIGQ